MFVQPVLEIYFRWVVFKFQNNQQLVIWIRQQQQSSKWGERQSKEAEQEREAAALADEAVVVGGYRLAYILNTIFADKNIPVYKK